MEPPKINHFPTGIFLIFFTPYVYTVITTIFQGKKIQFCTVSKWQPNNRFSFPCDFDFGENLKNDFPKRIFFFKLGDHEYINIAEIKFG